MLGGYSWKGQVMDVRGVGVVGAGRETPLQFGIPGGTKVYQELSIHHQENHRMIYSHGKSEGNEIFCVGENVLVINGSHCGAIAGSEEEIGTFVIHYPFILPNSLNTCKK